MNPMWAFFQIAFRTGWLVLLSAATLFVALRLASVAYADAAGKKRARRFFLWFCVAFVLAYGAELFLFFRSNESGTEMFRLWRFLGGLNWAGALPTLIVWAPIYFSWRVYQEQSARPLAALEAQIAGFRAQPLSVFEEKRSQDFLRQLKRVSERRPMFLKPRIDEARRQFLELSQEPPKEVCLQRAIDCLKQNRPAEALDWARRWKADSLEFFLLCLESQAWNECVERVDVITNWLEKNHMVASVFREEVFQILGDLPDQEGVRRISRERLTENRDMRRRRAVLEFKNSRDEVALKLLQNDWEAANWVRAAQASGNSRSPLPSPGPS